MKDIFNLVLSNLEMVGVFMIPFLFMRISDICFGTILSIKDVSLRFDFKKLLSGIIWGLIVTIGMATLVCGVVTLPALLEFYNIEIVNTDSLSSMVNVLSIIGIIVTSVTTYGKDAYGKLIKIFKISENTEIQKLEHGSPKDMI